MHTQPSKNVVTLTFKDAYFAYRTRYQVCEFSKDVALTFLVNEPFPCLSYQRTASIRPLEGFGHYLVKIINELQDALA